MPAKSKVRKERVTVYLHPSIAAELWQERAKTRETISDIANDILMRHYRTAVEKSRPEVAVGA